MIVKRLQRGMDSSCAACQVFLIQEIDAINACSDTHTHTCKWSRRFLTRKRRICEHFYFSIVLSTACILLYGAKILPKRICCFFNYYQNVSTTERSNVISRHKITSLTFEVWRERFGFLHWNEWVKRSNITQFECCDFLESTISPKHKVTKYMMTITLGSALRVWTVYKDNLWRDIPL